MHMKGLTESNQSLTEADNERLAAHLQGGACFLPVVGFTPSCCSAAAGLARLGRIAQRTDCDVPYSIP